MTKLKKTAYGAQMASCGGSAKGGVGLQSKVGWICKGAVRLQRCGRNAKGAVQTQRPPSKRKGGHKTQKDSRSCPDALNYLHFP